MLWIIYTHYKESFWANVVECSALLLVVLGAAIGVLNVDTLKIWGGILVFLVAFAAHFGVKKLAAKVNTYTMEKKIAENASYAKYIAVTYPDWTLRCIELNSEYADYGDNIPFVDFHPKRQRNNMIIQIVGLGVLLAIFGALIIWCVYIQNEYGI